MFELIRGEGILHEYLIDAGVTFNIQCFIVLFIHLFQNDPIYLF
jgi:hypothetical protein